MKNTFIPVVEKLFRTYLADSYISMKDCYNGSVLGDGKFSPLEVATELYKGCEVLEYEEANSR